MSWYIYIHIPVVVHMELFPCSINNTDLGLTPRAAKLSTGGSVEFGEAYCISHAKSGVARDMHAQKLTDSTRHMRPCSLLIGRFGALPLAQICCEAVLASMLQVRTYRTVLILGTALLQMMIQFGPYRYHSHDCWTERSTLLGIV